MMISPEEYYNLYLHNKNEMELKSQIRALKKEIGHLKNIIENPLYDDEHNKPSPLVRLKCNKDYLELAKQTLIDIGYDYQKTKKDLKIEDFNQKINHLISMSLRIDSYFEGYAKYEITFKNDNVHISKETNDFVNHNFEKNIYNKDIFIDNLKQLNIGEWRRKYNTIRYGYTLCDGIQWELTLCFNNYRRIRFYGNSIYPYNFIDLIGIIDNYY